MNDPQASLGFILRPQAGFETIYQGTSRSNPIPMLPLVNGSHAPTDALVRSTGIDPLLAAYAPVALGATVMILIPRCQTQGEGRDETLYTYEFRWRLRALSDWQKRASSGTPDFPYHLETGPGPGNLTPIPAFTSEVITPAVVGNGISPFIATGPLRGISGQGQMDAVANPFTLDPNFFFPPILRPCVGDQLSVVAYRTEPQDPANWDFAAAEDATFSNIYGTDVGGVGHPVIPTLGVWLIILNRNTTP
jgi:hypothetical protein